jgi:4'-phosphopantetheinyl transferase
VSLLEVWILPAAGAQASLEAMLGGRPIARSPTGKPGVTGGPHFNLSHSGDLALIARCADAPVGVDLEHARALRNPTGLARRMCSPRELTWAGRSPDLNAALLRLWVRKEAVAKAEGGGLETALSGIDVLDPIATARGSRWFVHDLPDPAPGYLAAVSWQADCP